MKNNHQRTAGLAIVVVFLMVLVACPPQQGAVKSVSDMTPKEKATFVMSMYNKQYDEYLAMYNKGEWTDAEKKIMNVKYEALGELYPYIKIYADYAEEGILAPATTEKAMLATVDKLLGL